MFQRDRRDAEMDSAGPCGNLWLPAVLKRLQISRSGSLCDANKRNFRVREGKLQGEGKGEKQGHESGGRRKGLS